MPLTAPSTITARHTESRQQTTLYILWQWNISGEVISSLLCIYLSSIYLCDGSRTNFMHARTALRTPHCAHRTTYYRCIPYTKQLFIGRLPVGDGRTRFTGGLILYYQYPHVPLTYRACPLQHCRRGMSTAMPVQPLPVTRRSSSFWGRTSCCCR